MAEWITCNECDARYGAFYRSCPRCKAQNHNLYGTVLDNQQSKNILRRKGKKILVYIIMGSILCSGIFFFILPSFVVPSPPITDLKIYALAKINQDRAKFGLPPVVIDNDNAAAQAQANELLKTQALSHWTTDGMKPYMRYSVYGGHDNVVQNVAQVKYGFVSLSVWNNNNQQQFSNDPFDQTKIALCKAGVALCDNLVNPYKAINELEYNMVYDDVGCCQNGHKMNILDKHHTHVSIGIAYDKFYLALVQNFEDKYTTWKIPISYDNVSNTVYMKGKLKGNASAFDRIAITYDPLPSQEVYKLNMNRESYSEGQTVAEIIPPRIAPLNSFDISFSISELTKKHGAGVYTIDTWYNDTNNNPFQASSVSLFVH